ncbi:MAG: M15 family metallopeptidase [Clostridia bacterium]|nr:M15 family metallopeptidase [Clostridia bacterium]
MKEMQLKIRKFLFIALVAILGILLILYIAFCRGGDYNSAHIDEPTTKVESTTEAPTDPIEEEPTDIVEEPEESTTEEPVIWDNYSPSKVLLSENWMLALINKNYPLDKNYSMSTATVVEGSSVTADIRVAEAYRQMYNAAMSEDVVLTPYSGYCSYQRQKIIYDNKVQAFLLQGLTEEEAKQSAEKRVEPAGCSENGAGLAVDVISASAGFASTNEYKWLVANAHNFGFVLRYPEDKTEITGMIYQPWHWRYVGVDVATEMKDQNLCLEEYLGAV